ncbi:hypothetical protein ACFW9D_13095, partial [Streptomyces sp. NPDC059524]
PWWRGRGWVLCLVGAPRRALPGGAAPAPPPPPPRDREKGWPFRAYLLWLTFPPIVLLFQGQPFRLVILYGVLGAAFMPFLALTLIWLLNSSRTPSNWRNGKLSNGMLAIAGLLFVVLCVKQIWDQPWSEFF